MIFGFLKSVVRISIGRSFLSVVIGKSFQRYSKKDFKGLFEDFVFLSVGQATKGCEELSVSWSSIDRFFGMVRVSKSDQCRRDSYAGIFLCS